MRARRYAWPWVCGGLALFAAGAVLAFNGVNPADESWFLQVVRRVSAGDALYRDVDFGVTPLSICLALAFTAVVGVQIFAVKVLSALLASASGLLVARLSLHGGAGGLGAVVCAALTAVFMARFLSSPYTPLAIVLFLACESVVLSRFGRRSAGALAAGALAGLSFAAKQNVGGIALAAVLVSLLAVDPSRAGIRRAVAALAAFAVLVMATIATMVAWGGVSPALDALGLGKHGYLQFGAIPYHETLSSDVRSLVRVGAWADVVHGHDRDLVLSSPAIVLPIVAALALCAAWARRLAVRQGSDRSLAVVSVFAVAAFLVPFPRYDAIHLAWAAGPLLVACAVAVSGFRPSRGVVVRSLVGVAAAFWLAFALVGPIVDFARGDRTRLRLPHYGGAWVSNGDRSQAAADVRRLRAALPGRTVFLGLDTASFYYLAAELRNPTRFDYPYPTTIDEGDAMRILEGVADGSIPAVCLGAPTSDGSRNALGDLERRLQRTLTRGPDAGPCRLWFPEAR